MKRWNHSPRGLAKQFALFLVCFTVIAVGVTGKASAKATPKVNTLVIGSREDSGVNKTANTMYTVFSRNLYPGYTNTTKKHIYDATKKSGTSAKVYKALDGAFKSSGASDINILYYTGRTTEPTLKEKKSGKGKYGIAVYGGRISYNALASYLAKQYKGKFIVITDTGFAEQFEKQGVQKLSKKNQKRFTCLLCNDGNKKSLLSKYTKALYGGAGYDSYKNLPADKNKDGVVTVSEAHAYGMKQVKKRVPFNNHAGLASFPLFQQADLKSSNLPTQIVWLTGKTTTIKDVLIVQNNPGTLARKLKWTTSDAKVMKVKKCALRTSNKYDLEVTALKTGSVTLKGYLTDSSNMVCHGAKVVTLKVKVKKPTIELDKDTDELLINQTDTLIATVEGPRKTVTWTSSDPLIATVSKKGKITPVKPGTVTITAEANGKTTTCKVKVKDLIVWALDKDGTLTVGGMDEITEDTWTDKTINKDGIDKKQVKRVVIKYGVTSIGRYAFESCDNLTSVTIPDSVTSIEKDAFEYCKSLSNVTIPKSVTSIGSYAFRGCNSLTSITISDGVTSIGRSTFGNCKNLTSVTIPDSVISIGDTAFSYCESLTSVTIPDSVTSIGTGTFGGCKRLTSVTIPDNVTSIGETAFFFCESLISVSIPDGVTSIGQSAFGNCKSLTSVTIPDSVISIGDYAFSSCEKLTSVSIPDGVISIGDYTFNCCFSLTSITIPDSVTSIGDYAFDSCPSLTSVTIPDSVTSIGESAFADCMRLKNVTIPNGVISIKESTFRDCMNLTSITIPDSVTSIADKAFSECVSLTSVAIPNSVTTIGKEAFFHCASLTSVTISDRVKTIEEGTFAWCYSLTSITIPENVTSIGMLAFCDCQNLTVTLPKSITSVGDRAFSGIKEVIYV